MGFETWLAWAKEVGIHKAVLGFLGSKGNFAGATADQWERVSLLLDESKLKDSSLQKIITGIIGEPSTTEFMAYRRDMPGGRLDLGDILDGFFS